MTRLTEIDKQYVEDHINAEISKLSEKISESYASDHSAKIAEAISSAIQPLISEITGLRDLLEETCEQYKSLQDKLIEKTDRVKSLELSLTAAVGRNVELHSLILEKADDAEAYSRKDSLRISGIAIDPNEDSDSLKSAVIDKLSENGVDINNNNIFRLHRAGKAHPMNNLKKYINHVNDTKASIDPRDKTETTETIVRFTNWSACTKVHDLRYKKDLAISVKTDLTKYSQDILQLARTYLKDNKLKAYCYSNGKNKLILKDVETGKRHLLKNFQEFKALTTCLITDHNFHKQR